MQPDVDDRFRLSESSIVEQVGNRLIDDRGAEREGLSILPLGAEALPGIFRHKLQSIWQVAIRPYQESWKCVVQAQARRRLDQDAEEDGERMWDEAAHGFGGGKEPRG